MRNVRLKICDLCGAPNLMENAECHVCGWSGHFNVEPTKVRSVIELARKLQMRETTREKSLWRRLHWYLEEVWVRLQEWRRRRRDWYRSPF